MAGIPTSTLPDSRRDRCCYSCGSTEHLARNCTQGKGESRGRQGGSQSVSQPARTKVVQANKPRPPVVAVQDNPLDVLLSGSESDDGDVKRISVGSHSQSVVIKIEGLPVKGLVDTGSDIMGANSSDTLLRLRGYGRSSSTLLTNRLTPTTTSSFTSMEVWTSRCHLGYGHSCI